MGERTFVAERIERMLSSVDLKMLVAIERLISTYINAMGKGR